MILRLAAAIILAMLTAETMRKAGTRAGWSRPTAFLVSFAVALLVAIAFVGLWQ